MRQRTRLCGLVSISSLVLAAGEAAADNKPARTDKQLIASAMVAASKRLAANAALVAMEADARMRARREGKNGWTCMPDNPVTPGPDPMCMDRNALEWAHAWVEHKTPPASKVGFMYMLAGGTDAGSTDPCATGPESGNHWISTGPQVMIVGADPSFYDQCPKDADPDTRQPYITWAGTPYQHLMAPVK